MNSKDFYNDFLKLNEDNFITAEECKDLSIEQLNWKRDSKTWSIAQILEHLVITNENYLKEIESKFESLNDLSDNNYLLKKTIAGKLLYFSVKPETTFGMKTPAVMQPESSYISGNILDNYLSLNKIIKEYILKSKTKDLNSVKIVSFVNKLIKMNYWEAFIITIAHDKRHMLQIERTKNYSGFPSK